MKRASSWYIHVCVNHSLTLVRFALGALAIAAMETACAREFSPSGRQQPPASDSVSVAIFAQQKIRTIDFFIYRDSLNTPLEMHQRAVFEGNVHTGAETVLKLPSERGSRIVLAIANSPREFRIEALGSFDSAELLTMYYRDEDPGFPLMSAVKHCAEDQVKLRLKPLLCPVTLLSVSNSTDRLLSQPVISLKGVNGSAEMLRSDGFTAAFTVDSPAELAHPEMMQARLPKDIGSLTQYPGTRLYCYPQDIVGGFGSRGCELVFTASSEGETLTYSFPLPKVCRGDSIALGINIGP